MGRELENIDLTAEQRKEIADLLKHHLPDTEVWAYGSRVKFTSKPSSDLDMVAFAKKEQQMAVADLKEAFEESDLPFRVDLFIWEEVPEQFHKNIEAERVVLQGAARTGKVVANEWAEVELRELVEMSTDKIETKSIPEKCYVSTDSMLPDFGGVSFNGATPSVAKTSSFSIDDVLFSNIRTYFRKLWIADRNGGCSNDVIVFRPKKHVHPRFLFYSLMDERFIRHTVQTSKGTKMPRGDKSAIIQYKTKLPPLPEQKAIAHILGSLDDKIELNRRMNETLEGISRNLFKSWFTDFDPVLDNAILAGNSIPDEFAQRAEVRRKVLAQNQPSPNISNGERDFPDFGKDAADFPSIGNKSSKVRKNFPDSFQPSELGPIPAGWEVRQVKDFGLVVCGKTPSKSNADYYGNTIPFIKIPDMHQSAWITDTSDGLSLDGARSQSKKQIPANSICVSCIATVGKVVITSRDSHTNQQINSVVPNRDYFRYYLYFTFSGMTKELHDLASGGSATLNLNTGNFSKINILLPSDEALESYFSAVDSQFQKMLSNDIESQTLTNLRDTLLPKLISGELRVEDV